MDSPAERVWPVVHPRQDGKSRPAALFATFRQTIRSKRK
jgi:hypothetical protein